MRWMMVFFILLQLSFAEEIQLKNGNKISGQIVGVSGNKFQVKTSYGDMQVPREDIVSITFPENIPAGTKPDAPPVDESLTDGKYVNRTAGFEASVPEGWVLAPEMRSKDVVAALTSADETRGFVVTMEKFDGPLSAYLTVVESNIQGKFVDFKELSQSDTEINGVKAKKIIVRGTAKNSNVPLKFVVFVFANESDMVRLSFFTMEPLFDNLLPKFEAIAASYHPLVKH